jgi:hypothetical protein
VKLRHAGEPFRAMHEALVAVPIDWARLDPSSIAEPLLTRARETWAGRAQSEYQSIQVMTRFLQEVPATRCGTRR